MRWTVELAMVQVSLDAAKKRHRQLQHEENKIIVANSECSFCLQFGNGKVGEPCRKLGTGDLTWPHAERRRDLARRMA